MPPASSSIDSATSVGGFWDFLLDVLERHGAFALGFVVLAVLFYKMVWKVWESAMRTKDEEIERLVEERNRYQALVFDRLQSSQIEKQEATPPTSETGES